MLLVRRPTTNETRKETLNTDKHIGKPLECCQPGMAAVLVSDFGMHSIKHTMYT